MRAHSIVFRSNAEGSLRVDLLTRLAILEPVIKLIGRLPRCSTITGSWMRSRGVDLGPTGRAGAGVGVGAGSRGSTQISLRDASQTLRNQINRLRRDLNLYSTAYNNTKIKT